MLQGLICQETILRREQRALSNHMLKLLDSSVDLLWNNHKHGEQYYWILYYAFLSPQELRNTEEIIEKLEPHIDNISFRTYYRRRRAAIEALSTILCVGGGGQGDSGYVK